MPVPVKSPVLLPRFVPHNNADAGVDAGAGSFSKPAPTSELPPRQPETPASLAHDARNVLSGLMLYCELLGSPGVLSPPHGHYAEELEAIAGATAQMLEKLIGVATAAQIPAAQPLRVSPARFLPAAAPRLAAAIVADAAAELRHLHPLLAAIAGPAVRLSIATSPCAGRTALAVEDLTRVLVNLVRNAADAMPGGGHIGITARYGAAQYGDGVRLLDPGPQPHPGLASKPGPKLAPNPAPRSVLLSISDDGPGIPEALRARIFDLGFSTHGDSASRHCPALRGRGMGLSIARNLVESAGGSMRATASRTGGARFEIALPLRETVTSGTCLAGSIDRISADSGEKGCIKCQ